MSLTLNRWSYEKLIRENIEWLDKVHPERSLEKEHIKHIMEWSIKVNYDEPHKLVQFEKDHV